MSEHEVKTSPGDARAHWSKPSLQKVGDIGNVFQMPGGGKLSLVADDSGDEQRKPKGLE